MAVTAEFVRSVFKGLETGDGADFFKYVVDNVDWTVMGAHPSARRGIKKIRWMSFRMSGALNSNHFMRPQR